jgi:periplasmic divalent cation tolerance protein
MRFEHILVFITVPSQEVAQQIANTLMESNLAACVNIIPGISSIYHWQGGVEQDSELLLIVKTKKALFEQLETMVISNHPYDLPEIIAMPIVLGSEDYLNWIENETA